MRVLFSVVLAVLCVVPSTSQCQSKLSSTASHLDIAPSVRAVGMGETGVTLTDPYSYWSNPASVALQGQEDRLWLTGWPGTSNLAPGTMDSPRLGHVSIAMPISTSAMDGRTRRRFALAYYQTWVSTGDIPIKRADGVTMGTYRETFRSHNLVLAASLSGRIEVGVGGTLRWFRYSYWNATGDQIGLDLGLLVCAPLDRLINRGEPLGVRRWSFTPALGVAVKNVGPALQLFRHNYLYAKLRQPRALHIGVSTEILLTDRQQVILSLIPALEWKWENSGTKEYRLGVEAGAYEAVYVRAGLIPLSGRDDQKTFGFSLRSRGIARRIWPDTESSCGLKCLLRDRMDIEFSYASYLDDDAYYGKIDRFGLSLTLR